MNSPQAPLIQKAKASIRAAKILVEKELYDFAVSRAYYAMFYVAEAILLEKGLSFSRHSAVISAFGQHLTKKGHIPEKFHRYLIEGQESRSVGDYDTDAGLTKEDAEEQIRRAEEFLQLAP